MNENMQNVQSVVEVIPFHFLSHFHFFLLCNIMKLVSFRNTKSLPGLFAATAVRWTAVTFCTDIYVRGVGARWGDTCGR